MRRFTKVSITMLSGLVAIPACASIVGIDTDRPLLDAGASSTTNPTGTGTTPPPDSSTSSSSSSGASSSGGEDPCAACKSGGFTRCAATPTDCLYECDPSKGSCPSAPRFNCPDGGNCTITCKAGSCDNATCSGGDSCTFHCESGGCNGASCSTPTCTFTCNTSQQCDMATCSAGTTCNKFCQGDKPCTKSAAAQANPSQ